MTVKALVACDKRAWPAAASAACRTAVALHRKTCTSAELLVGRGSIIDDILSKA